MLLLSTPALESRQVPLDRECRQITLENQVWDALDDICAATGFSIGSLAGLVSAGRPTSMPLESALRNIALSYYLACDRHLELSPQDCLDYAVQVLQRTSLPELSTTSAARFKHEVTSLH